MSSRPSLPQEDDAVPSAWSASLLPGEGAQELELAMKRRLLLSLSERGSTEAAALVIPGVLCWMYGFAPGHVGLWACWAGFVMAACGLNWQRRRMQRGAQQADAQAVQRWERHYARTAVIVGLFWIAPLGFGLYGGTVEFRLVVYICLCAILASTATFVAPLPKVFWRFYAVVFVPMAVAVPWAFPLRWKYLLPLTLLYGAVIARHAWGGRRLIEQQVEQERQRLRLAERYRLAKDEAERALRERDRFISTTSHDLRQPLHAMGLLVQAAVQRNADAQLSPLLRDVQECVRSLSFMFNALLDLSRLESGEFTARHEDLPLAAVFEDAARIFGPDADHRGLQLRLFLPRSQDPWVRADPTLLRQMVFNLLQNALRYTPSGGVLVGARLRGSRWRIEVWDTGSGIAQQDRERIYAPYARGQSGLQATAEGHGLGLAVVARGAQLMRADYGFESTPQRGSCFWLELPAVRPGMRPTTAPAHRPGVPPDASLAGRCLLVDDDPQVTSALTGLLQSWGVQVRAAASGAQALAWLDEGYAPDAVVCDYRLAGGESGLAVLQAVLQRCGHSRGTLLTGEHAAPGVARAEEDGYLVLRKPLEPELLYGLLAHWLPVHGPSGEGAGDAP
ncbi:hybrid sensor histidine kinase/response regulator [Paracidovorax wautersii]|uniref:hybrid sensor histidine kinase/response regulator n=1 Tax=Paracidovorax wautersii TaxID=1177982 RepID=UPI0031DD6588